MRKKINQGQPSQLELGIPREWEPDRNHHSGGRSFYFFDLDDNVIFLPTQIFAFHNSNGSEVALTTGEFALESQNIGVRGPFKDYKMIYDDAVGSFRRFRDRTIAQVPGFAREKQPFVEDFARALDHGDFNWKGPSWHCFFHAAFNQRPMALITARGHQSETIKEGIRLLVEAGFLPQEPNYLAIYPVSNGETRQLLGDSSNTWSVAQLKRAAIHHAVQEAMKQYGVSEFHRFGMSDDHPENVELITEAMRELKRTYPRNSFYVIDTHRERYVKQEVFVDHIETSSYPSMVQLQLFNEL